MAEQDYRQDQAKGSVGEIKRNLSKFEELINNRGDDCLVTWREYLKNKSASEGKIIRFGSGFIELDYFMDGFQSGELVTISGYTGMGKTLFLKSLVRSFGIENVPVCLFCYEDRVDNYLKKLSEENINFPIYLPMSLKVGDMKWIEERVLEAKLKYDVKIVTIDHLHYLLDMDGGRENISLKMGSIMRYLKKNVAEAHNVVVFLVAHQMKAKDETMEASLETIRDSALIGNESDSVIIVQRIPDAKIKKGEDPTYDLNYGLVKIEKARRTGAYRKRLTFQKVGNWLSPL